MRDEDEEEISQSLESEDIDEEEEDFKDDFSPLWVAEWKDNGVPSIEPCPHCQAKRTFEFQARALSPLCLMSRIDYASDAPPSRH